MREETQLYKRLKQTAKKRGVLMKDIGKLAGIGDKTVLAWRYSSLSKKALQKVADALGTTPQYLQYGKPENQPHELEWYDLGMGFYGKVPDDLVHIYKKIGEKYILEHPERFTLTEKKSKVGKSGGTIRRQHYGKRQTSTNCAQFLI